ncbi:MAG: PhnD/SsuA/transferrin family substrate-binding protein [Gammaproteobacteria bacterium]|nr:PhnD/SsuA/transferrin family substrate-binding protein [Gammaproteobacteria bacterium]
MTVFHLTKKFWPLFCLTLSSWSAQAEVILNFGLYSSDKATTLVKKFRPFLNVIDSRMENILGEPVKIRIQVSKTYEQGINSLVSGKTDFARFGPVSYIKAKDLQPDIEIIAMESNNGEKQFYGIICTATDSNIKQVRDLKGKKFAFGNKLSTIGRFLSQLYLSEKGIQASDLSHFEYLDRHDKVGTAVAQGQFDAGALQENTFNKLLTKGWKLREIARFVNITKPWITRAGLDLKYKQALRQALLELDEETTIIAIKNNQFIEGNDSDYAPIREAINRNREFFNNTISDK